MSNLTVGSFSSFLVIEIAQRSETVMVRFWNQKGIIEIKFRFFNLRETFETL